MDTKRSNKYLINRRIKLKIIGLKKKIIGYLVNQSLNNIKNVKTYINKYNSFLDKAKNKNIYHPNKVSREKGLLLKRVNSFFKK
ncbi:MAG: hypothetical protein QTO32_00495 [Candidatus Organicella extenuata]|uniref:30S ribosomal protein S20 n=1 Tax=Candidatus Organicella extenuata TaxID=2841811 RepID=A0AA51GED1_9BACT|nr:MAG: hypothetical protein QTO32_00495 [Candidatus Organicella extenuata]